MSSTNINDGVTTIVSYDRFATPYGHYERYPSTPEEAQDALTRLQEYRESLEEEYGKRKDAKLIDNYRQALNETTLLIGIFKEGVVPNDFLFTKYEEGEGNVNILMMQYPWALIKTGDEDFYRLALERARLLCHYPDEWVEESIRAENEHVNAYRNQESVREGKVKLRGHYGIIFTYDGKYFNAFPHVSLDISNLTDEEKTEILHVPHSIKSPLDMRALERITTLN